MARKPATLRDGEDMHSLIIKPYDEGGNNLAHALSNDYTPINVIKSKTHFKYLQKYLGRENNGLNIKTILIEDKYISRDFLDDYTGYFAKCYETYDKLCKRIHFFTHEFTQDDFDRLFIDGQKSLKTLLKGYKGCMVVKRIPYSVIGYTLLDTYTDRRKDKKKLFGTKEYNINLLGIDFKINSLAYQEQDSVVSACATTAIWNVLSKAADSPRTLLKSPIEITASAGKVDALHGRIFPNKNGLSIEQMINALYEAHLVTEHKLGQKQKEDEPEIKSGPFSNDYLKELIHAYAPIGIPQILILKTFEKDTQNKIEKEEQAETEENKMIPTDGLHAITVVGYKNQVKEEKQNKLSAFEELDMEGIRRYLKSRTIERVYCHDDQHGPFVRCNLLGEHYFTSCWDAYEPKIEAPEALKREQLQKVIGKRIEYAEIRDIIIPLYPKIRISYDDFIQQHGLVLINMIQIILKLISAKTKHAKIFIDWDIQLIYSKEYKKELIDADVNQKKKKKVISANMPKYIWRARLEVNENKIMDFIFDATDVHNGNYFLDAICHDKNKSPYKKGIVNTIKANPETFEKLFVKIFAPKYSVQKYIDKLIIKLDENEL